MNDLKINNEVFRANSSISPYANNNLLQRIYIWDENLANTSLKNVVIISNFDNTQNIPIGFPYDGTWYDLMNNTTYQGNSSSISLNPGEFRIFEASIKSF